jgi:hypothetical protein
MGAWKTNEREKIKMYSDTKLPGNSRVMDTSFNGILPDNTLLIDVQCLPECVRLWNKNKFGTLGVSDYNNLGLDNVDCLNAFGNLSSIFVMINAKINLEPLLRHADNLRGLCLGDRVNGLKDCRPFIRLESLAQIWLPSMKFSDSYPNLVRLALSGSKSKTVDLTALPRADNLKEIDLVQPSIESLEGIERYSDLEKISIYQARKLRDISQLSTLKNLKVVEFEKCRHLTKDGLDWSVFHGLHKMNYVECSPLSDLQFVRSMPDLRHLVIMDTDVLDGDLNPVADHQGLEHFACTSYKHFTHTEAQLRKIRIARKESVMPISSSSEDLL